MRVQRTELVVSAAKRAAIYQTRNGISPGVKPKPMDASFTTRMVVREMPRLS